MFKEFKTFISRGNVVDMAVGVIIGSAFGKIVSSLVADVFTPVISLLTGGVNFSNAKLVLKAAETAVDEAGELVELTPALTMNYGMFIQNIIDFLLVAICVFLFVKTIEKLRKATENLSKKDEPEVQPEPEVPAEPVPTKEELLLAEIRDLLKEKNL